MCVAKRKPVDPIDVISKYFETVLPTHAAVEHMCVYVDDIRDPIRDDIRYMWARAGEPGKIDVQRESSYDRITTYATLSDMVSGELRGMNIILVEVSNVCVEPGCTMAATFVEGTGNPLGIRANKCAWHVDASSVLGPFVPADYSRELYDNRTF